ncbi:sugar O-acyltransferase, sialic acid O-acetyltransferase NeuD family [Sphingopyxis sp. YR583]|uniref:acetyltransferase n=1 Tax=Sphingopyxis sp. YR583 TaxID=1881047 RepID=UPI0008A7D919|nr:acetyltransferase [Sphingopyxis sp. YR583]SEH18285.1 sugar O-acyltransferase, sialic acid O-acetyltransferase NeuD family [Sphingopyxis sp. YR583]
MTGESTLPRNIAIYGTGGCGRALAHSLIQASNIWAKNTGTKMQVVFVDDDPGAIAPLPVVPFECLGIGDRFVIGVADGHTRRRLEKKCLEAGLSAFDFRAPSAEIGLGNSIGTGVVLMSNAMITTNVRIGRQFQCNIYSYVEHDCVIGDFVTFAPRVSCNGNVHIGDYAYVGAGAVIKQGAPGRPLTIGQGAVVGMGAVVTKDVAPGAIVVGNPARVMEQQ